MLPAADIEGVVDSLAQRGVAFEKYPFVQDNKRGIWTAPGGNKLAWFRSSTLATLVAQGCDRRPRRLGMLRAVIRVPSS